MRLGLGLGLGVVGGQGAHATGGGGDDGGGGGSPPPDFDFASFTTLPDGLDWDSAWNASSPTVVEFTNLTEAGEVFISSAHTVTSLSFPVLSDVEAPGVSMFNMAALTTVLFPALATVDNIQFSSFTPVLTTFTLGAGVLKSVAHNVIMTSCALDQASVDNLLIALAALDGTNGTTLFAGTVAITGTSAAPSGAGAVAKLTLTGRGVGVTTN